MSKKPNILRDFQRLYIGGTEEINVNPLTGEVVKVTFTRELTTPGDKDRAVRIIRRFADTLSNAPGVRTFLTKIIDHEAGHAFGDKMDNGNSGPGRFGVDSSVELPEFHYKLERAPNSTEAELLRRIIRSVNSVSDPSPEDLWNKREAETRLRELGR